MVLADNSQTSGITVSKSALTVLFSVVFLDNLGFAIVLPYLFFYASALGASPLVYGILLASYSLLSFIFTPIVSRLSDRYGRRKILLIALAVSSFSYFLFGSAQVLWLLFVGRMLAGTTAATVPVAQAYVADITTEKERLRYLGLLGAAAGVAFIMGPAIGGTLSQLFGYAVPSFLASALAFANLILAYFRLTEPPRSGFDLKKTSFSFVALRDVLRKRLIILLFTAYFLFFVAFVFLQAALSPWLKEVFGFGSLQTGLVFFFVGSISAFTQAILLPRLSKKFNRSILTIYSIIILSIGLFILAFVGNLALLVLASAVISFGFGIQYITFNTLISLSAPKEAQGGTLGIAWALAGLAQTIAPVLAESAFSIGVSVGFSGLAFIISAAISATTIPLVLTFKKAVNE
jgi:MFS transporter, DHA1 family, tetracycline resistance protein